MVIVTALKIRKNDVKIGVQKLHMKRKVDMLGKKVSKLWWAINYILHTQMAPTEVGEKIAAKRTLSLL